ncbi:MAG: N-acetylglucosamine-6-phosphate deacetylase [Oscillospiraceae bacterium]
MILKNGFVFTGEGDFRALDVEICGERIARVAPAGTLHGDDEMDVSGKYITPGFVDIHIHGAKGSDFCDGSAKDIETIAEYLGGEGVTSFCGTTMAFSEEILDNIITVAKPYFGKDGGGAVLRGVNMEGPFFSKAKKGAQAEEYIVNPDYDMFARLFDLSGGNIKFVDMAPELSGSLDFITKASEKCTVSIAHTTATYDEAKAAYLAGASHTTHLFNAMPAFNHRDPGVVGAASDYAAHVEMISDGIHLHPAVVRSVFEWFGDDRVCLISDSMRACGMPNGDYSLGGQKVVMKDGKATLVDGTIAGSATCLAACVKRAVSFGVPIESALKASTINPAKAAGLYDELGSIEKGKRADVLVLDISMTPEHIFIGGKKIK